jgi:hypothetical protein
MFDLEVFVSALVPADIFVYEMGDSKDVFLDFGVELPLKDSKDIFGTDETVGVVIEQEECNNMGLPERHGFEAVADLLKLFVSDVGAELIEV